jgi:WD40 repeat protein
VNLHGPVRAEKTAGSGQAIVTLSFEAWAAGHVAPSTHAVTVKPAPAVKSEPVSARLIRSLVHPDRKSGISLLKFSADGKRLAVAGYPSGVLQVWDPAAGKELAKVETPPGLRGSAEYVALTADWKTAFVSHLGRKVVRAEKDGEQQVRIDFDGEVRVWDVATGKNRPAVKVAPNSGVSEAVVSPDGTKLITAEARSYDPKGAKFVPHGMVFRDLSGNGPPVELGGGFGMAVFAPDGRTFVLAENDRSSETSRLVIFDGRTGRETAVLADKVKGTLYYPSFSPDSKRVAATHSVPAEQSSTVRVWDVAARQELAVLKPVEADMLFQWQFSPDGRFVGAATYQGAGHVWDAATGKVVLTHRYGEKGFTRSVAVSPDGRWAAVVGTPGINAGDFGRDPNPADLPQPHVVLYDLTTGKAVETLVCPHGGPGLAAFSPDGQTLAVGGSGAVHLFDVSKR